METNREGGFTLVEMLVALLIFALLAGAGVGLLRTSVDLQGAVARKLERSSATARLHSLFVGDVAQAIARPLVGVGDARKASFEGSSNGMSFVRGGWSNFDARPRSSLQRVTWSVASGGLTRAASAELEGAVTAEAAVLEEDVIAAALRYRRADGSWSSAFVSSERELLPAAVEVRLSDRSGRVTTFIAATPPRGVEPPPAASPLPGAAA